ncbi:MAG: hypothetical protein Q6362_012160 [Candidatus Wukongarchaeota archaeon]|nr:hypothetical protein [Candidatus Wukongarchaeota archaeon]
MRVKDVRNREEKRKLGIGIVTRYKGQKIAIACEMRETLEAVEWVRTQMIFTGTLIIGLENKEMIDSLKVKKITTIELIKKEIEGFI